MCLSQKTHRSLPVLRTLAVLRVIEQNAVNGERAAVSGPWKQCLFMAAQLNKKAEPSASCMSAVSVAWACTSAVTARAPYIERLQLQVDRVSRLTYKQGG